MLTISIGSSFINEGDLDQISQCDATTANTIDDQIINMTKLFMLIAGHELSTSHMLL